MGEKTNRNTEGSYSNDADQQDNSDNAPVSEFEKRDTAAYSNWGSNPYFLGKRINNQPFWAARGKKDIKNEQSIQSDYMTLDNDGPMKYRSVMKYPQPYISKNIPNYIANEDDYSMHDPEKQKATQSGLIMDYLSDLPENHKDDQYWRSNDDHQEKPRKTFDQNSIKSSNKRGPPIKFTPHMKDLILSGKNGNDKSQFWMARGRRFWTARGKKSQKESSTFNRLSRLVNSGIKNRQFLTDSSFNKNPEQIKSVYIYDIENNPGVLQQPNFWVVRGKKSASNSKFDEDYDNIEDKDSPLYLHPAGSRDKKGYRHLSALARMNGRTSFRSPKFWANRGRKNFWAARGKRSLSTQLKK